MLLEVFRFLTTPCPRPVRRMGYLKEMIGLTARHQRCRDAWQPHLEASRALIIEAARSCPKRHRVVVLGSGLLFDIPLVELSHLFDQVVLVDILHMPGVRKTAGLLSNVELLERDISGVVGPLYRQETPQPKADLSLGGADLVISANVVSQLPILPEQYASRAGMKPTPALWPLLIEQHLAALARFPGVVCLITEIEHVTLAGAEIVARHDPLLGVLVPPSLALNRRSWDWQFAPHPERHKQRDDCYRVAGFVRAGI